MTNDEITKILKDISFKCDDVAKGIENNLSKGEFYSSRIHQLSVNRRMQAIKIILEI